MLSMYNVFALAASHILFVAVRGQLQNLIVNVGLQGSFYSPETVSVAVNNSVTFEFFGAVHSVTQSSFADPCAPLPGGFHSGYLGLGPNNSAPLQVWNLIITNVTSPIWYFCAVSKPVFHCSVGMVGVINPPSQDAFNSFSAVAKLVTTIASIGPTPILSGIGAFATSTPTVSALAFTPSPSLTSLSTSTPTPSSTSSASPSATATPTPPNLGAIVGGTVGGAVGLIAFMLALWYFCLRNNKQQAAVPVQNDDFFRYNPVPDRRPLTEGFHQPMGSQSSAGNLQHNPSMLSNTNASSSQTARLAPLRRSPGPVILEPPYLHRQMSQQSDINSTSSNPTTSGRGLNVSEPPNNVDIRALAQEVAAVLYQNPAKDYSGQDTHGQMTVQNLADEPTYAPSTQTTRQPPPNYRAATGPTSSVGSRSQGKAQYP